MIRKVILAMFSALACLTLGACCVQCCTMKAITFWSPPEDFSPPIWSSGGMSWFCLNFSHIATVDPTVVGERSRAVFVQSDTWADFSIYDRAGQLHQLQNVRYTIVTFPLPLLSLLLAAYPVGAFSRALFLRYRDRKEGSCRHCGYNLTGNVLGVCPECGEKI